MNSYDGPERRDGEGINVLAERLDNHLDACEEQNETVLREIREMRAAMQPVIDAYTTAKGLAGLAKIIGAIGVAIGFIVAAVHWMRGA